MMDGYDMNGWGWLGMTLMVLVTVAIVGLVVWAVARRPSETQGREPSAREQLDARLARGEIDTQEYRERLDALSGRQPVG
jgi:putative membrane protein